MKRIWYLLFFIVGCDTDTVKKDPLSAYSLFSASVVHLEFTDAPSDSISVSALALTNIPKDGSASNVATVYKAGDYYLNIEIDRPTQCFLSLEQEQYNIFVFPHDTTHIIVRNLNEVPGISFRGVSSLINQYYLEKKENLGYADIRFPFNAPLSQKTTYKRLVQTTDSIINRELAFFQKYTSKIRLPQWFKDYEESEIVYAGAGYKTAMPHANEFFGYFKDSLPTDYYDFLNEILINNPRAALSAHYFWFLDDYFLRNLPFNETKELSGFGRISKTQSYKLNQSKNELSDPIKKLYHLSNLSLLIPFFSDSLAIDSLAKSFELSDYQELVRIAGTRSRNTMQALNLHTGDTIPGFILATTLDSLISIRDFSHQILYVNFWATWCGPCLKNIPELNELIAQYEKDARVAFLNICLDSEHDKWLTTISNHKLKGINLYTDGNWNSKVRAYFSISGIPHYAIVANNNILLENATEKAPAVKGRIDAILSGAMQYP